MFPQFNQYSKWFIELAAFQMNTIHPDTAPLKILLRIFVFFSVHSHTFVSNWVSCEKSIVSIVSRVAFFEIQQQHKNSHSAQHRKKKETIFYIDTQINIYRNLLFSFHFYYFFVVIFCLNILTRFYVRLNQCTSPICAL